MSDKKFRLPKSVIYALIAIAVFLPTILAIVNFVYVDSGESLAISRASEVILFDSKGNELFREHESQNLTGDTSLIGIFNVLYKELTEVNSIPKEVSVITPVTVTIIDKHGSHTLKCYFPLDGTSAYCTDRDNTHYIIRQSDSKRFLVSQFAQSLYPESVPPVVKTLDGEVIPPASASWHYKNLDNDYVNVLNIPTAEGTPSYAMTGGIALDFSIAPDRTDVYVYQDGECVFEGPADKLDTLILSSGSDVNIHLNARWYNRHSQSFYGTLDYSFNVNVHSRAQFSVSSDSFGVGEFITLKATNADDLSKLKFASNDSDFSPNILLQGTTAYVLIPHSVCEDRPSFDFTVSYGVSSASFSITSKENSAINETEISESQSIFELMPKAFDFEASPYLFLGGKTVSTSKDTYQKTLSFGQGFEYQEQNLTSFFEYYTAQQGGSSVFAVSAGKVVHTDTHQDLGKYVVIDMGAGLRVWYFGLSVVDVRVGEYIAPEDVIGKSGTLPFEKENGFGLMLTCYDSTVNPSTLVS